MDVLRVAQSGESMGLGAPPVTAGASTGAKPRGAIAGGSGGNGGSGGSGGGSDGGRAAATSAGQQEARVPEGGTGKEREGGIGEVEEQQEEEEKEEDDAVEEDLPPQKPLSPFYTFTDYVKDAKQQLG
jgi:hypothetical protein